MTNPLRNDLKLHRDFLRKRIECGHSTSVIDNERYAELFDRILDFLEPEGGQTQVRLAA